MAISVKYPTHWIYQKEVTCAGCGAVAKSVSGDHIQFGSDGNKVRTICPCCHTPLIVVHNSSTWLNSRQDYGFEPL